MKLRAKYFMSCNRHYCCRLYVEDKGDYESDQIFRADEMNHPDEFIDLHGRYSFVVIKGNDWIDLQAKIGGFIGRIDDRLTEWRSQQIPDNQHFEI